MDKQKRKDADVRKGSQTVKETNEIEKPFC